MHELVLMRAQRLALQVKTEHFQPFSYQCMPLLRKYKVFYVANERVILQLHLVELL
jgi:hypothetical protein